MRLTFLGTGTSFGVPVIGCGCRVCTSEDPRDRRSRHGALVETDRGRVLIDTPPELRLQLVAAGVDRITAVWLTHGHADHIHGLDDLRIFSQRERSAVDIWSSEELAAELRVRFGYVFGGPIQGTGEGSSRPDLRSHILTEGDPVELAGAQFTPVVALHGAIRVFGFRVGSLGYLTDAKSLTPKGMEALSGVDTLVVNALWEGDPHPTHMNVEEAVELSGQLGARRTYLTHLTHRARHAELAARLPAGVEPAFDGLTVEVA